jgi:hypothetical protein
MNAKQQPAFGTAIEGGFFAGRININGREYGIVVAPKAEGELKDSIWIPRYKDVPGALSFSDGLANSQAMADAGSKLATKILALSIGGYSDWYLPAVDELEICYRAFKPTTNENSLYSRSGINVSAVPPTYPYTRELPGQTTHKLFRADAAEAFDSVWYWSSTQRAGDSDCAWLQVFGHGYQGTGNKGNNYRARAVRRFAL